MTNGNSTKKTIYSQPPSNLPSLPKGSVPLLIGLGIIGLLIFQAVKVVPAGNVGVVFSSLNGVQDRPRGEGVHFVLPIIETLNLYDARLQEITLAKSGTLKDETSIRARSREGLEITADVTVQFRINRPEAAKLHHDLGPNYLITVIRPKIRSKMRDAIGTFSAADLISTKRKDVEKVVTEALRNEFKRNYLVLDSVLLRELSIPKSVAEAIEQKQTAEQQVAVEKNRLEQAKISAQRAEVKAEGEARAAVAKAKGEAEALSLRGRALRENPQLIQLTVAEKLSPGIKTVMLPSDGNFLLNVKDLASNSTTQPASAPQKP